MKDAVLRSSLFVVLAILLAGCADKNAGQTFPDPFEGKGTPIGSTEAIALARVNATRDHANATLVLVTGGIENRTDGRISPWDVLFFDAAKNEVYWYVVAGQGAREGANHVYPPPEGFPTRSIDDATAGSIEAVDAARDNETFRALADDVANGAFMRAQLETWRGGEHDGKPFWALHIEGRRGIIDIAIDARTGTRV